MNDVAIIGAGKVGTALGQALSKTGYRIIALTCSRISSARKSQKIIGQGTAYKNSTQAAREADIVILSVPDGMIRSVSEDLSGSDFQWDGKYVFHCSGLLPSHILDPLKNRGAWTASFHPVQSFSQKDPSEKSMNGIFFGIEGGKKALALARDMAKKLGAKHITISPEDKPLYHASCCLVSNYFVALMDSAAAVMETIGIAPPKTKEIFYPLLQGTLQNVKKFGIPQALTGPVIRGDVETVEAHIRALKSQPVHSRVYRTMARQALEDSKKITKSFR